MENCKSCKAAEREKSNKLSALGFIVGASLVAENEKADGDDMIIGGILGLIAAKACEVVFPKTTRMIKSVL